MGFKSDLVTAVQGIMSTLGQADGLAPYGTYVSVDMGTSSFDPATQTFTTTNTSYPNVPMVLARFSEKELGEEGVIHTDLKILIAAGDLTPTPKDQDKVITDYGDTYEVKRVKGVPGDSLYIIQGRLTV